MVTLLFYWFTFHRWVGPFLVLLFHGQWHGCGPILRCSNPGVSTWQGWCPRRAPFHPRLVKHQSFCHPNPECRWFKGHLSALSSIVLSLKCLLCPCPGALLPARISAVCLGPGRVHCCNLFHAEKTPFGLPTWIQFPTLYLTDLSLSLEHWLFSTSFLGLASFPVCIGQFLYAPGHQVINVDELTFLNRILKAIPRWGNSVASLC